MIAFIIVGLGYVLLAYAFGVGTGLFGVKNVWDSGNTILLFSGLALILSGISNPIRNKYTAALATVLLLVTGSMQSDRGAVSLVLLTVLWIFYYMRKRLLKATSKSTRNKDTPFL